MKPASWLNYFFLCFVAAVVCGNAFAGDLKHDVSKTLAVVPVKNGNVDQNVYRQFDRLVPDLKKISKNRTITLECRYAGKPDREQDVQNAYKLAARIEKYLRVRHKLDLDLWITVDIMPRSADILPVLTMAVLSGDSKKLDDVLVNAPKN